MSPFPEKAKTRSEETRSERAERTEHAETGSHTQRDKPKSQGSSGKVILTDYENFEGRQRRKIQLGGKHFLHLL